MCWLRLAGWVKLMWAARGLCNIVKGKLLLSIWPKAPPTGIKMYKQNACFLTEEKSALLSAWVRTFVKHLSYQWCASTVYGLITVWYGTIIDHMYGKIWYDYSTVQKAGGLPTFWAKGHFGSCFQVQVMWLTHLQCKTNMLFWRGKHTKRSGVKKQKTQLWQRFEPRISFLPAKRQNTVDRVCKVKTIGQLDTGLDHIFPSIVQYGFWPYRNHNRIYGPKMKIRRTSTSLCIM